MQGYAGMGLFYSRLDVICIEGNELYQPYFICIDLGAYCTSCGLKSDEVFG